ncbi:hypothetical protein DAPPUDRAFT_119289 [Daphnia pulex]|uniref:Uncharacterized protein n=1 Tax=Daphnia pulex TaxID=6669 RepID=E9HY33_DAPPU|nr:hypothetical protein DAPPUDRAFT_119289 [Daphnia pulex]|eukprot:EFX63343.1 hypothetical protein DAPPUDRAFT_119289 [Daphnia pulex]
MCMYQICLMKVKCLTKFITHMIRARSFFMESCGLGTEILVPMLAFAHDGRGTSTNVHRYLRDARSSSFTVSKHNLFYFTGDLASFWTTSVIASVRCYTPAASHSPRDYAQVMAILAPKTGPGNSAGADYHLRPDRSDIALLYIKVHSISQRPFQLHFQISFRVNLTPV